MDEFTEVQTRGFGSRLLGSITGVVFGLILFLVAFPVLWFNEGYAVRTARSLKEGAREVINIPSDRVDAANEGKLVHLTGEAVTGETLQDALLSMSAQALKLQRKVEMYQWKETSSSRTEKNVGGSETTRTTYSYAKVWSEQPLDSAAFKKPQGHENPGMPYCSEEFVARDVKMGAFRLTRSLVGKMSGATPLSSPDVRVPDSMQGRVQKLGNGIQTGDPAAPQIGDLRITYAQLLPQDVSVIARQASDTFEPFPARAGRPIELLAMGVSSADAMFAAANTENAVRTWILRAAGFFAMFFGLVLVFRPFATIADVLPFLRSVVRFGTGLASFCVAFCLSLVTIALAWIAYRPLVGGGLLILAFLAIFWLRSHKPKKSDASAPAAA